MLEAENIFFSYQKGEPPVLKGVSLSVGPGERAVSYTHLTLPTNSLV